MIAFALLGLMAIAIKYFYRYRNRQRSTQREMEGIFNSYVKKTSEF